MRFILSTIVLTIFAIVASAAVTLKPIVVSYADKNTPDSVVQAAKDAIISAGGKITHEYRLIKGFSAEAPESVIESVQTLDATYPSVVEEDQLVHTQGK